MMLEEDEYKRDDFVMLQMKNSGKDEKAMSEHSKS